MFDITLAFMALQTISITVGVIYHIMTLRNTRKNQELTLRSQELALETRQAQLFMQLFDKTMSKEFTDAQKELNVKFNDYQEYKDWMTNIREDQKKLDSWLFLVSFYEGLGLLVMEDLVSIRMVTVFLGGSIMGFFDRFGGENVHRFREETGIQGTLSETEYLYLRIKQYIEENPDYKDYQIPYNR